MIIIIGAGISGITAGNLLEKNFTILERSSDIGGLARQYFTAGGWMGFGGHYFHFQNKKKIKRYLEQFQPFREYKRDSRVFLLGRLIPFPLQYHLSYLPKNKREIIVNQISSRVQADQENLAGYLKQVFGLELFNLFFEPFLSKYYGVDLSELVAKMDRGTIPIPDRKSVVEGAKGRKFLSIGYNAMFYYPKNALNGFLNEYVRNIRPMIRLQEEVKEVRIEQRRVITSHGAYDYDALINTMPLNHLIKIVKPNHGLPSPSLLKHTSTLVVNVVLKQRRRRFHWVYLPEKRFSFYRVGYYPGNPSPSSYLEKTIPSGRVMDRDIIFKQSIRSLKALRMIEHDKEILHFEPLVIPVSYILFDRNWQPTVSRTLKGLRRHRIYSIGRFGSWRYSSMSDDVQMAMETAASIRVYP